MKTIKLYLSVILLAAFVMPTFAQHRNELSQEDKKEIQQRIKQKIDEFQFYLSSIVNMELSDAQRKTSISSALVLFIGKGEPYYLINEYGERENYNGVRMQISSVNANSVRWRFMKAYLNNLYTNIYNYTKVVIESADAVRVDNIHPTADGRYEATAYFCQKYISYSGENIAYSDITGKKIKVYIDAIEVPEGTVWDAKLGDIYVTSTERIK